MAQQSTNGTTVHVRFEGHSQDIPLHTLDLGPQADDATVRRALAAHLQISPARLRDYVIDRHPSGNLTVRPEAVFG
jgi:hypothetical protein